jgi:hypothetical protein
MCAAEKAAANFNSVANYFALAMLTNRRNRLDCTFEAVKCVPRSCGYQFECLIVFISANFAFRHMLFSSSFDESVLSFFRGAGLSCRSLPFNRHAGSDPRIVAAL